MKFVIAQLYTSKYSKSDSWLTRMSARVSHHLASSSFVAHFLLESVFSLSSLEAKLVAYMKDPAATAQPFDASDVPKISRQQAAQESART